MPLAGLNNNAMRLFKQDLTEAQHLVKAAGLCKHLRVGRDTDYAAKDLRRNAIPRIAIDDAIQPRVARLVAKGVSPKCMNEDVDVRKDHESSMTSSRALELLRSTSGRTPPEAFDTGSFTCLRRAAFGLASTSDRPSSIRDVSVRPQAQRSALPGAGDS